LTKTLETPVHVLTKGSLVAGKYRVVDEIGRGGMGVVYCAHDDSLARDVAIKVLPPEFASEPERLRRFEQEAKAAGQLSHPNILTVHEVGSQDGAPYLVTELLEGESLRQSLSGGALPMRKAIDYGVQVARGLAVAHEKGIVHRDLKPENLFITRRGQVKILDFGLAKLRSAQGPPGEAVQASTEMMLTEAGAIVGTAPYMSPEQVRGQAVDQRTDIFSFGAVLYEMLSGQRAFKGATAADTLSAILKEDPPPLRDLRQAVSPGIQQIVDRCLEKRPEDRFSSAHDLSLALEAVSTGSATGRRQAAVPGTGTAAAVMGGVRRLASPFVRLWPSVRAKRWLWLAGGLAVLAALVVASGAIVRQRRVSWARNQALPELMRLAEARDYWPAFLLARKIEVIVPGDPTVQKLCPRFAGKLKREFRPAGATVLARPRTGGEADWVELGKAGGKPLPVPLGYSVFKVQDPGFEPREFAMTVSEFGWDQLTIGGVTALARRGAAPDGMVRIETPANSVAFGLDPLGFFDFAQEARIGGFFMDTHEVTNREYKRFVDAGGYQRSEYWTEPFERDGKTLSRDEAMSFLRDTTGRPGPAGWQVGTYEVGTDALPVTGLSWYEAAAYAAFAGKRLPSVYHFAVGSARFVGGDFLPGSNFSGKLASVGSFRGSLNYWGLYDMAGNAREWCINAAGRERFALGGAADGPAYMFWNTDSAVKSSFDRNPMTGFRCIRAVVSDPQDAQLDRPVATKPRPDWAKVKGFSDEVWKTWQGLLSYVKAPLQARSEWTDDTPPSWRLEKVTFNAAYPNERVVAYLFLPKSVPPPYQAVIIAQAGYGFLVNSSEDGRNTQDLSYWDYLVKDGRAVVYPIFKGSYERGGGSNTVFDPSIAFWIPPAKDISRTIDYLETRTDIRADRIGYFGLSAAGDAGTMICAVEKRFKAAVFLGAGLGGDPSLNREIVGFAHYCSTPVQMVNGRSDGYGQQPVFDGLKTPPDQKRHVEFDGDHTLAGFEKDVMKVNLEWFDRFLGPVR
jgi:formylglycine-generating enzyme required for sulfatase activity/dienelactone hydrolase